MAFAQTDLGFWGNLMKKLGKGDPGAGTDIFSSIAGQMGAQLGGRGSWQEGLGGLAAMMGQSGIIGREAESEEERNRLFWNKMIKRVEGGGGMTEKGMEGPTTFTRTGNEVTIKGDVGSLAGGKATPVTAGTGDRQEDVYRRIGGEGTF